MSYCQLTTTTYQPQVTQTALIPQIPRHCGQPACGGPIQPNLLYNCRESSTNRPCFLQNKPNLPDGQMNVNICYTKVYSNETAFRRGKNKPNTKPNKANFPASRDETNPIQTQFKPNTNPISKPHLPPGLAGSSCIFHLT